MIFPTVTEITPRLEPVTPDSFLDPSDAERRAARAVVSIVGPLAALRLAA